MKENVLVSERLSVTSVGVSEKKNMKLEIPQTCVLSIMRIIVDVGKLINCTTKIIPIELALSKSDNCSIYGKTAQCYVYVGKQY